MKKPVFFLMFALVLLTVSSAFASEIVPLQFSYPPIDFPNIFLFAQRLLPSSLFYAEFIRILVRTGTHGCFQLYR